MSSIIKDLDTSYKIVEKWGGFILPNGKSITEHFTIDGYQFWEIMTPYISLYDVPSILSNKSVKYNFFQKIRPHISILKRNFLIKLNIIKLRKNKIQYIDNKPVFLFLGFNTYMFRDVLEPIATKLLNEKTFRVLIIEERNYFENNNYSLFEHDNIWEYWNKEIEIDVINIKFKLKNKIREFYKMNIFSELMRFDTTTLWPKMKNSLNWLFTFHLQLILPQFIIAKHILTKNNVSLILSSDIPDPRNRVYALLSRQLNIKLLEVQFGPNGEEAIEWRFNLSDLIATWGINTKESLLKHGLSKDNIVMTGSPRHDAMFNLNDSEKIKLRNSFQVPENVVMILLASTYQQKEYNLLSDPDILVEMKKSIFEAVNNFKEIFLIVKPHPLENIEETTKLIGNFTNIKIVNKNIDIRNLIIACDVFIAFGSTSTVDALIANKLTICPSFPGWTWNNMFIESKSTLIPMNYNDLLIIFKNIVNKLGYKYLKELESNRIMYLEQIAFKTDGKAAERIATLGINLIKN